MGYNDETYDSPGYGADDRSAGGYGADLADLTPTSPGCDDGGASVPPTDGGEPEPVYGAPSGGYGQTGYSPPDDSSNLERSSRRPRGGRGGLLAVVGAVLAAVVVAFVLAPREPERGDATRAQSVTRPEGPPRFVVVAIGCTGYAPSPLAGCAADAKNVAMAFNSLGYEAFLMNDDCADVMGRRDNGLYPSKANIDGKLDAWLPAGGLGPQDTLILFFSGHGLGAKSGDYLKPLGAAQGASVSEMIDVNALVERLQATRAGHILLITDSCRSYSGQETPHDDGFGAATDRSMRRQQLPDSASSDSQLICFRSCKAGQYSYCDADGSHFTNALCEVLRGSQGVGLTADTLYRNVKELVARRSESKQVPAWLVVGEEATEMALTPSSLRDDKTRRDMAAAQKTGDLASVVAAAQPGTTVNLQGTFKLNAPLVVDKPLNFAGDGLDRSKVTCAAGGFVVKFIGDGPWMVSGVCFEHTGSQPADVVFVSGGQFNAERCRFTGAVGSGPTADSAEINGVGLLLAGLCAANVTDCEATKNGFAGVDYSANSRGVACKNRCRQNRGYGVVVANNAAPTLDGNACCDNGQAGIVYCESGGGVAAHNVCRGNGVAQLRVNEGAHPKLEDNEADPPDDQ